MAVDPFPRHNFLVDLGDGQEIGIAEVEGLEALAGVTEYRIGSEKVATVRKLPELVRYADLVLRRGIDATDVFSAWWRTTADGIPERRDVTVVLLDGSRSPVMRWHVTRAWPRGYAVGPLAADGSGVATESLTLAHEGFTVEAS